MQEHKKMLRGPSGKMVEGIDVAVLESTERFSETRLEDGTVIRAKVTVLSATRIDEELDEDGNPLYAIKSQNVVNVIKAPRKKV